MATDNILLVNLNELVEQSIQTKIQTLKQENEKLTQQVSDFEDLEEVIGSLQVTFKFAANNEKQRKLTMIADLFGFTLPLEDNREFLKLCGILGLEVEMNQEVLEAA